MIDILGDENLTADNLSSIWWDEFDSATIKLR